MCSDYTEMIDALHDMEKEASEGLVAPEKLDQLKNMVEPIKNNYMRISYIMYLLNLPNRESKVKERKKHEKIGFVENVKLSGVHNENKEYIDKLTFKD